MVTFTCTSVYLDHTLLGTHMTLIIITMPLGTQKTFRKSLYIFPQTSLLLHAIYSDSRQKFKKLDIGEPLGGVRTSKISLLHATNNNTEKRK